jgi:choline monooxygenase
MTLLNSALIDPDISRAWTLPAPLYFDRDVAAQERELIFGRTWQVIGHRHQVDSPGDYFTTQLVGEPLLVVRGADRELRAFYNVCRHRAGPPAEGCGSRKLFRCVYHGWTYNLYCSLNHATEIEDVEGFRPEDFALAPVRCEEWFNLIFVNLDLNARPLSESLGELVQQAQRFPFQNMKLFERRIYDMKCNWKTYVDNYLEGYHIPFVHPELNREIDARRYSVVVGDRYCRHSAPTRDGAVNAGRWLFRWPNLALNLYPHAMVVERMLPTGPHSTRIAYSYFFSDPDDPANDDVVRISKTVIEEDRAIVEAVQRNLDAGVYERGRLSRRHEAGVAQFQQLVRTALDRLPLEHA